MIKVTPEIAGKQVKCDPTFCHPTRFTDQIGTITDIILPYGGDPEDVGEVCVIWPAAVAVGFSSRTYDRVWYLPRDLDGYNEM